jgi:arsenite-transporting ATPase
MTLLIVSGAGGSGVTTVARGIARGLRDDGYSTVEINSSVAAPLGTSQVWSDAVATFGVWLQRLGASTLTANELEGLSGLNELITGVMVADSVGNSNIDVVVWDMGSSREALRTLQLLDTFPVLLDRLLTGPVAAHLSAPDPDALIAAWYGLVTHVSDARDVVQAAQSVLVGTTTDVEALVHASGTMRLYGCMPSALVLNKVPEVTKSQTKRDRRAMKEAVRGADAIGVPVVVLPQVASGIPKSAKVTKWLKPLRQVLVSSQDAPSQMLNVHETKKGYTLNLKLRKGADVQVGRRGDSLLVVCDGHRRQVELPAVLKRCLITGGGMVNDSLVLKFVPNPKLWREQS